MQYPDISTYSKFTYVGCGPRVVNSKASGPSVWVSFLQIYKHNTLRSHQNCNRVSSYMIHMQKACLMSKKACAESNQDHVPGLYVAQTTRPCMHGALSRVSPRTCTRVVVIPVQPLTFHVFGLTGDTSWAVFMVGYLVSPIPRLCGGLGPAGSRGGRQMGDKIQIKRVGNNPTMWILTK
jgi:hypothetical protein